MIVNILNKQYDMQPCMMCNGDEYEIAQQHKDKENLIVIDAIKCAKCGKVYYTLNKLIQMQDKESE